MYKELNVIKVRVLLAEKGVKATDLAKAMEISDSGVSLILAKKTTITFKGFLAMCNFLNVEPQILLK